MINQKKLIKYSTYVFYNFDRPDNYLNDYKLLGRLVYNPNDHEILTDICNQFEQELTYKVLYDDKLMIAVVNIIKDNSDIHGIKFIQSNLVELFSIFNKIEYEEITIKKYGKIDIDFSKERLFNQYLVSRTKLSKTKDNNRTHWQCFFNKLDITIPKTVAEIEAYEKLKRRRGGSNNRNVTEHTKTTTTNTTTGQMKLTRYKTFVLSCYPQEDIIIDQDLELKLLRKLVYNPENTDVLNKLKNMDGAKSYQVIKDDKLMIAIVFFFNTDQKIELNKTDFLNLFKTLSLEVTRSFLRKEGKQINSVSIGEFKNFYKELNSNDDTYVWHYYNTSCNNFSNNAISNLPGSPDPKFIDFMLKPYNITIIQPRIPWKEQNLIWLKTEIENKEFIITEQGHLTVVDGIAYGSVETILNWRNILPKNSWKLISDEPIPVRTRPVVQVESVYDAEYMKAYYARKEDKYKMKIKIQSEAYKFGMSYKDYRRQYYPDFTFSDEKVKFSVVRPQQGVPLTPVVTVQTTVPVKPKIQVQDLLTAYLTVPI